MTTYNTGNPVESADPLDLYDNAQDLDARLNSGSLSTTNRLGGEVKTWAGIEVEAVGEAVAAAEAAVAAIDIAKPYIASTQPASVELGNSPIETFAATKSESSSVSYSSSCTDTSLGLVRTLYGITEFEPFHPADFPVDFTPNAPQLLIGSAYTTDPSYTERVYQGCPSAAKTGGRLWCGFRGDIQLYEENGDTVAEHTGNFVTLCKSDDNGVTWSEYGYIRYVDDPTRGVFEPVMWVAPDGKLWVFVTVDGNNTPMDGVFGGYVFVCKNPGNVTAEFLRWETPVKIFPFGFLSGTPVDVDGRILMPCCYWEKLLTHYPIYPDKVGKHIYELDWKNKKAFLKSTLPDSIDASNFDEDFITQSHDGSLRAIWRTASSSESLETSISHDGGASWGAASKYTGVVGANASSRAWLGTSPSGRTVLIYNNVASVRQYLTIALSDDGGASYPHKMLLEAQPASSSYPWVVFGDNGDIYVFYDKGRSNPGFRKIVCNKLNEAEIISGSAIPVTNYVSDKGYLA